MIIYELVHIYEGADNHKSIGFFKTQSDMHIAIKSLTNSPGFCDYPEAFLSIPRYVHTCKSDLDEIYVVHVYYFPREYQGGNYTEFGTYLGFFEKQVDAENMLACFLSNNRKEIPGMELICSSDQYMLNTISAWEEGFTTEYMDIE